MVDANTLHRKRGQLRRKLNDFSSFMKSLQDKPNSLKLNDIKEVETRLERVIPLIDQLEEIQNQIFELEEIDEEAEQDYTSEFEGLYFFHLAEARALLEKANSEKAPESASSAGSVNADGWNSHSLANSIKLPTISLPKFAGKFTTWLEFHDSFSSLIHENKSLNDIQKFHYLRASLEHEAADIIKSLSMSSLNYNIAWELLCNRYTNKKLLVQNHISELVQLKETRESAQHLRAMADTITKNLHALRSLNQEVESWDPVIIYLASSRLDKHTRRDWESLKHSGELPTLKEFLSFVNTRAEVLDNVNMCPAQIRDGRAHKEGSRVNKTFLVSALSCYHCKESHPIYKCDKFLALNVRDRVNRVRDLKLCDNCLRPGHVLTNCGARAKCCKTCKKNHNSLLHFVDVKQTLAATETPAEEISLSVRLPPQNGSVLLATAIIQVRDNDGNWKKGRALLDCASQSNFITREFQGKLGIKASTANIAIQGINQIVSSIKQQCSILIKSLNSDFSTRLHCLIINQLSDNLPSTRIDEFIFPENLQLADSRYGMPGRIDLLIGAQLFWSLLTQGQIKLGKNLPVLQNTHLGWIVSGSLPTSKSPNTKCFFTKHFDIQDQLQRFWEVEECPKVPSLSAEERQCEEHFLENVYKNNTGRYVVSLPFRETPHNLGNSRSIALKRLESLERRFKANSDLRKAYTQFMDDYISLGHMTKIEQPNDEQAHFYMPHHSVISQSSTTTRLRVVFDGSCLSASGASINSLQAVGPTLQSNLFDILVRFRQHSVVFSVDIQKMYRQVLIKPEDRRFQRILWRKDALQPVDTYELNTVTYGTAAAAYLATRCLIHIADEHIREFPSACHIIKHDSYVDDILSGGETVEETAILCRQIKEILGSAHFELHKWVSNNSAVFPDAYSERGGPQGSELGAGGTTKTLGLYWSAKDDTLTYEVSQIVSAERVTKRQILSVVSQIFDPLGLLSPAIIIPKVIMQLLWQEKLEWDDEVSQLTKEKWARWSRQLSILNQFKIARQVLGKGHRRIQLHGFSDASEIAYCACVYARTTDEKGITNVKLICAKAKVAPLKKLTIPRLELCGALLLSRLLARVRTALNVHIEHAYLWSDSTITLAWINSAPSVLKVFVSHRVAEIQSNSKECTWLHVPTASNPADLGSRGVFPGELRQCNLWWNGPEWLQFDRPQWPAQESWQVINPLPEMKRVEVSFSVTILECPIQIARFSNYNRLIRAVAFCCRFIRNCRGEKTGLTLISGALNVEELNRASELIIKVVQNSCFLSEIHRLRSKGSLPSRSAILSLTPFLDAQGLLRVGGRLQAARTPFNARHPILLPKHHFTQLLFEQKHRSLAHAGPQLLLAHIREKYWPLGGKNYAKRTLHNCSICFRGKPTNLVPQMGNLPPDRLSPGFPFQTVGVDFAGPFNIRDRPGRGCKYIKAYIALFICFTTKAIHIETVTDLSTEAFIAALRRFVARRGKPIKIYSDNGSNFKGAANEINRIVQKMYQLDAHSIQDSLALEGIAWAFNPPNSPHFGGLWEAGVKSFKFHFKRIAGNASLTFEQLCTFSTQIEAILNSRPLTPMSDDPSDLRPITPSHFLIGRTLTSVPDENVSEIPRNRLSHFQHVQKLQQHFWERWRKEYLHSLQQRRKWTRIAMNLEVGKMVLLKVENVPPLSWPVGRVVEAIPGKDGVVRVVCVKTSKGVYKRAVAQVYPLPLSDTSAVSENTNQGT